MATVANHVAMGCRMLVYQNSLALRAIHPPRVQVIRRRDGREGEAGVAGRGGGRAHVVSSSLMDHRIAARTVGLTCVLGPFLVLPIYLFEGPSGTFRFGIVCLALLFLPMSMYISKRHLRSTLWREIKSMW